MATQDSNSGWFVAIPIILIIFLIFYGIWIYNSYQNNTGFFAPYTPVLSPGLTQPLPTSAFTQLTPEQQQNKSNLVNAALTR